MRKFKKRVIAAILTVSFAFSMLHLGAFSVSAFDMDYISKDGIKLGYSIVNGYSKLSTKAGSSSYSKTAVYSGVDISSPYILALAGVFFITSGVDLDRVITDNDYTMEMAGKLESFINKMGVKNEKASALKDELTKANIKIISSFDSLGLFIIEADDSIATQLMDNDKVDFVLAGGGVPANMKDLNLDGITDEKDARLIQQYLTRLVYYSDSDEKEYIKFACDINGDKKINIIDATEIYEKIN